MAIRRLFFRWLLPSALLLPLWLLVGYIVFQANVFAILWLLFLAMPAILIGQLIFTLMVRSRPSVRRDRAVSWLDVLAFGTWHVLTILVGLYNSFFALFLTLAIIAGVGVLVSCLWQLWKEATGATVGAFVGASNAGFTTFPPAGASQNAPRTDQPTIVINEKPVN